LTREDFDTLEIIEQINYINKMLDSNSKSSSLTKVCDNIGIARKTISNRFKKIGYEYNNNLNKYIVVTETTNVVINKSNNNIKSLKSKINNKPLQIKDDDSNMLNNRVNNIEEHIKCLYTQLSIINDKLNNNVIEVNESIISKDIELLENKETVTRSYRVYSEIQAEFKQFCDDNRNYKVQDILSSALKEYMNKFK
jgi:hypothetical protein